MRFSKWHQNSLIVCGMLCVVQAIWITIAYNLIDSDGVPVLVTLLLDAEHHVGGIAVLNAPTAALIFVAKFFAGKRNGEE